MQASASQRQWSRPFSWLVVAFLTGITVEHCCSRTPDTIWIFVFVFFLLGLLLAGTIPSRPLLRSPIIPLMLFSVLGFLAGHQARPDLPAPPGLEPFFDQQQTLFLGEVSSPLDFYPEKTRLVLQLTAALLEDRIIPLEGGVLLTLKKTRHMPSDWFPGDKVLLRLNLKHLHNFSNPGGYDYVRSQAERGTYARAYLADDRFMVRLAPFSNSFFQSVLQAVRSGLERFRQRALLWIQGSLPPDAAAFNAGLLLGYQNLLSDSWRNHLNRAGATHLLSISGLHMGLVSLLVFWIVRRLLRVFCPFLLHRVADQRIAVWPAILAAALYALIAGFSTPAIWRSMIMLSICLGAAHWYIAADPLTVLAASALVILLIDPNSLWQVSFQLTFLCMFAIFILYPRSQRFHLTLGHPAFARDTIQGKLLTPFEEAFWLSIAVNIMVLPLTAYYFQGISLAGFLANIALVPITGFLVLPLGLASLGVFAVSETLALPILKVQGFFMECFQALLTWFSQLSWSYFWVGEISLLFLVIFYTGMALLLSSWRRQSKVIGTALLILIGFGAALMRVFPAQSDEPGRLRVTIVDVGQGSSTLLRFPTGTTMLVDGGGYYDESFDIGRAVLAPFLWHSGIRGIDYVVLSHDHPDHRNGLRFVLSHFDVGCFWETGITLDPRPTGELSEIAVRRRIPVKSLTEILGTHSIGGCRVRTLHPDPSFVERDWDGRDLNNVSLVLQIDFGKTSVLVPGDIDQTVETRLFQNTHGSEQLLLISPHHGSEQSNPAFLFDTLRPQAVVFACGYDNLFGFPSARVLAECAKRSIPIYRTDLHGAIEATSDGRKWDIRPIGHHPAGL